MSVCTDQQCPQCRECGRCEHSRTYQAGSVYYSHVFIADLKAAIAAAIRGGAIVVAQKESRES